MTNKATLLWTNPKVLRWARERLNLTPEDVEREAEKLKRRFYEPVSADDVIAWEEGRSEPTLAQLETLAEIYVCPVGYFFLESPPEVSVSLSFRGLSDEKRKDVLSSLTLRSLVVSILNTTINMYGFGYLILPVCSMSLPTLLN